MRILQPNTLESLPRAGGEPLCDIRVAAVKSVCAFWFRLLVTGLLISPGTAIPTSAQVVSVTMQLDNPTIGLGGFTTLHVYAQVVPAQRPISERIFSWYVDLLNPTPGVAQANYAQLQKPASDNNPQTSSAGTTQAGNQLGIYDTFINDSPISKSGTGVNTPVELFRVTVQGIAPGQTTFSVRPGTGVSGLDADFLVATTNGGDPLLGGIYDAGSAVLQVSTTAPCQPLLSTSLILLSGGTNRVALTFAPCPGHTNTVEFRDSLTSGNWQALPGAPHNTGSAVDTNKVPLRFYRVRVN